MGSEISRERIAATEKLIRPHVRRTPVIEVDAADFGLRASSLCFKLELGERQFADDPTVPKSDQIN